MQKPLGITVTAGLMAFAIVLDLIVTFTTPLQPMQGIPISASTAASGIYVVSVMFAILFAVYVWFYWNAYGWAKWVVILASLFHIFNMIHISRSWQFSHLSACIVTGKALLAAFLLWYLNTPEIRAWFMARERTGQPPQ